MMIFNTLAQYFEKLEKTSSRLVLIDILTSLFQEAQGSEIAQITYLLQSRIAPFYIPLEIGMNEKLVVAAISQAFCVDKEEILAEYRRIGDLGDVAEKLAKKVESQTTKLLVKDVFKDLSEIAKTIGEGAIDKKVTKLANILQITTPIAAKHLVRIPLGSSRIGVGDSTVLDAFAQAKIGNRSGRKLLENAYNKTSDLGLIGEVLWSKGIEGINKLDVMIGRPLRSELCERLPNPQTIIEKMGGEVHVQNKLDGFRVQIHLDRRQPKGDQVRLFSRNLEETTHMFPELIKGALSQINAETAILDAEALAYNPESEEFLPFQETTKRRRKYGIEEMQKKLPLKAFVFDMMYLNDESLVNKPLKERIDKLMKYVKGNEILLPQKGTITKDADKIQELFDDALTKGLEGLIIKRPDSLYEAGARNFNWVKLKKHSAGELKDTIDVVILGYIFGKGKRADFGAGALLVGIYDKEKDEFVTVSKIGTGLTDEEWREIHQKADKIKLEQKPARVNSQIIPSVWIKPELVIEVLADEITRSPIHTAGKIEGEPGYALRFPRMIRFRSDDKRAEDATTVSEFVEMYKNQFKKG